MELWFFPFSPWLYTGTFQILGDFSNRAHHGMEEKPSRPQSLPILPLWLICIFIRLEINYLRDCYSEFRYISVILKLNWAR